jgi:NAD(P)-dependent dehydrogenase (short-subunit alcohol dehydrogenase family)
MDARLFFSKENFHMSAEADLHDIRGHIAVVSGGGGVLGGSMAHSLARQGAAILLLDINDERADRNAAEIRAAGGEAHAYRLNVLDREQVESVAQMIAAEYGAPDILINAAGGNVEGSTIRPGQEVFGIDIEQLRLALDLNLIGTLLPTMKFGAVMAAAGKGSIINISSMAATTAITRVMGYSIAKSGVESFTRWMAMEMAMKHGDGLRVNAIAPGFFISEQNRDLLIEGNGEYSERARKVIAKTPMGRFGRHDELNGAVHFLASAASSFVTGAVIPVDGGFSSFSGV